MISNRRSRKLLPIALLSASILAFAACGDDEPAPDAGPGGGGPQFDLVSEGRIKVGSDIPYPPFEFEDDAGDLTGFDVEIVSEIADRIGLEHDPNSDWISTNFDTIFQQLQRGANFDIVVAAVTAYAPDGSPAAEVVEERRQFVDFSAAYYPSLQALTVNTEETPDVAGVDDLPDGARVAVQRATTGAFYAQAELEPEGVELVFFDQSPPMYLQLQGGQVDAVFNDLPTSEGEIEGKDALEIVEQVDTGEEYGIAVSKENQELVDAIDGALEEMFADGTYARIFKKYFPEQTLPDYAQE